LVIRMMRKKNNKKTYPEPRTSVPATARPATTVETPAVVKENAPIAKKAAAFVGTVAEAYQTPEPRGTPVKVADFDDIEGVKNRQKKWEEGGVTRSEGIKAPVEGYKLDETEQTKARKQKWEEGQIERAESIKAPVEGYKLDETEEVKARKQKWEGGQVISAAGTSQFSAEGYKLQETTSTKDRLNKWSQVASNVPTIAKATAEEMGSGKATERRKQWEEGNVISPTKEPKGAIKIAEEEGPVDNVKDRLNKWSEVTKDPEPSATRKEPLKIYEDTPPLHPTPAQPEASVYAEPEATPTEQTDLPDQ